MPAHLARHGTARTAKSQSQPRQGHRLLERMRCTLLFRLARRSEIMPPTQTLQIRSVTRKQTLHARCLCKSKNPSDTLRTQALAHVRCPQPQPHHKAARQSGRQQRGADESKQRKWVNMVADLKEILDILLEGEGIHLKETVFMKPKPNTAYNDSNGVGSREMPKKLR